MRNALIALVLLLAAPSLADAGKRKPADVQAATTVQTAAKAELKKAKAAAKLANHRVKLAKARASALKARQRLAREQWIADCVHERTGPVGGITELDAIDICTAEVPDGPDLVTE